MNIRIAIADDHPMIISGLQNILFNYPHISLIGTYTNGVELMKGLQKQQPDVLILDIQLPGKTGDELAPVILKKYPDVRILALTNFDNPLYVYNMQQHGVLGYLLKTTDHKTFVTAIETVYNNAEYIEASMKERVQQFSQKMRKEMSSKPKLTQRQKQILQLIVNGHTSQEIADKLFLSLYTVENYRGTILLKLDVKNMAELIKKSIMLGLVTE